MKKILYILFAMGLIVSSCSKDIDTDLSSVGDVAASFTNATITRATNGEWDSKDEIGIFAYDEAGAIYNNYENIPYMTINGGPQASFTPSGTIIYYPTGSSKLSFIAYSPYQESADNGLYDINLSAQSTPEKIDLIVANDGVQYSNTDTEASLQLDHKLAKLTMTLAAGEGLTQEDLAGVEVKLTKIATEGTYDLKGGSFTPSTADQTITPRTITADSKYEAIIFPYAAAVFDVEFYLPVTGKTYTWEVNGVFTSGKDHAYIVTIAESKISVNTATLSGWGVNDSEDIVANKLPYSGGNGTITNPYLISNIDDLKYIATEVDNGTSYEGCYFEITNNIDLQGSEVNQWTPIGNTTKYFSGSLNGNNFKISGLYINSMSNCQALFGYINVTNVSASPVFKNITIQKPEVAAAGYAGSIIGYGENVTIENCHVEDGSISISENFSGAIIGVLISGSIIDCTNSADVQGVQRIGGMVGHCSDVTIDGCTNLLGSNITSRNNLAGGMVGIAVDSRILDSTNEGNVTATNNYTGGIVGEISESVASSNVRIYNCVNKGIIVGNTTSQEYCCVGGIAGWSNCAISTCSNNGSVTAGANSTNIGYNTGGIVGSYSSTQSILNCINSAEVIGNRHTGGIAGATYSGGIDNCTNTANVSSVTSGQSISRVGGIVGYSYSSIVNSSNSGDVSAISNSSNAYCYQSGGIVGYYEASSAIEKCHNSGDVSGKLYVGGIAGRLDNGGVRSCSNTNNTVSGTYSTGGILGYVNNTTVLGLLVLDSFNTGDISVSTNSSYSNSGQYVGGIAGTAIGLSIENCYNKGSVTASKYNAAGIVANYENNQNSISTYIVASYNEGTITSDTSLAFGIIGSALGTTKTGTIIGCYNVGDIYTPSYGSGFAYYNKAVNISCCYTTGGIYSPTGSTVSYGKYDFCYPSNYGYASISQLYYVDNSLDGVGSVYTSTTVKCTMAELNSKVDTMNETISSNGYKYKYIADPDGLSHPTLTATE